MPSCDSAITEVLSLIKDWKLAGRDGIRSKTIVDFVTKHISFLEDPFRQRLEEAGYFQDVLRDVLDDQSWIEILPILERHGLKTDESLDMRA